MLDCVVSAESLYRGSRGRFCNQPHNQTPAARPASQLTEMIAVTYKMDAHLARARRAFPARTLSIRDNARESAPARVPFL
jgi:hypothetical protein